MSITLLGAGRSGAAAPTWQTTYSKTLTTDQDAWNGYTARELFEASELSVSGSQVRFTLEAGVAQGTTISAMYLQEQAAAGDLYDFASAPVEVLFSAGSGVAISAGTTVVSDALTFAFDESKSYVLSYYLGGGASVDMLRLGASGHNSYYKLGNDMTTVDATGYSASATVSRLINKIEVFA